jgi:hypothetical protein
MCFKKIEGYARHTPNVSETLQPQVSAFQCVGAFSHRHIGKPQETAGAAVQPTRRRLLTLNLGAGGDVHHGSLLNLDFENATR